STIEASDSAIANDREYGRAGKAASASRQYRRLRRRRILLRAMVPLSPEPQADLTGKPVLGADKADTDWDGEPLNETVGIKYLFRDGGRLTRPLPRASE